MKLHPPPSLAGLPGPVQWLLLALAYYVAAQLALLLATVGDNVTPIWPSAGIALAALLSFGGRLWAGVAIGALAVNLSTGMPVAIAAGVALGNTLNPWLGAMVLRRVLKDQHPLATPRGVFSLLLVAALGSLVSASVGTEMLWLGGLDSGQEAGVAWLTWWLGDSAGIALAAPLLLVWQLPRPAIRGWRVAEGALLLAATVVVGLVAFNGLLPGGAPHLPLTFLPLPVMVWALFRFGAPATVIVTTLISLVAIWGTEHGHGPFAAFGDYTAALLLQLYVAILSLTAYMAAAVVVEREQVRRRIQADSEDLEQRVLARTRELTELNRRLGEEATERAQAETGRRRMASILDVTTDMVGMADGDWRPFYLNPAGRRMLGIGDRPLDGSHVSRFHPGWVMERLRGDIAETLSRSGVWRGELAVLDGQGREIPTSQVVIAHRRADGKIDFYSTIARDISADKAAERELRLAASVFEEGHEGIMITDRQGTILRVNRAFTDITGYLPEEAIGRTPQLLKSDHHDDSFFRGLWSSIQIAGFWQGELWNRRRNGEVYPVWCTISAITDEHGAITHYTSLFIDITEQKLSEERIYRLAHYDVLTDLPNRRLFQEHLNQAVQQALRHRGTVAVIFVDLDQFKLVNDSLGHAAGDSLLQEAASRIVGCLRNSDVVARWGGDEFAIILPDIGGSQDAAAVATKILEAFAAPIRLSDRELFVSVSLGLSLAPDDGSDPAALLRNADMAMYRAKARGRNNFQFFTEEMNADLVERLALEHALRHAVARGELVLHYQPQIDLASGRISAVEALVRWEHPELGTVPPARFIPLAEETGQIIDIGNWVLREACRQHMAWAAQGLRPVRMAVNLSGRSFQDPALVETVNQALRGAGMNPRWLELELTETFLVANPEETIKILSGLKSLGVQIAIDDFGMGYSSLSYLKRFAIDRLKIDQSFVRDLPGDHDDAAIVATIIAMGKNLKLQVTGEGVETADQLNFLRVHECDEVQGYYFSRPVAADDLVALLRQERLLKVS